MSLIAERLRAVRPSETKAMTARAAELREQGIDVITLSQGEPDFDTPAAVCEAGIRAIRGGRTKYTAVAGIKPLRQAIRESFSRDHGLDYALDQITVGCGAKQVVFNSLFASLNPGDEVVIPTPCWVLLSRYSGARRRQAGSCRLR
ncbi:aspartate/methionine/tyrosine aminotransferase [Bradyrhizobium japonicum]